MSHAAWHSLSHAVDHLNCLRTLLKDAHMMHMYAPYPIPRGVENACAAVWLLAPDDRAERILRRLRLAALDIRGGPSVSAHSPVHIARSRTQCSVLCRDLAAHFIAFLVAKSSRT
ncbi:hypothetical protein [Micromonospora sp. NPDC005087]|uniref:hypothetical protein n=1 Tax=Micromonospora sp. NPDC005087 TaxID=3364225 RepID=UPI003680939F